MSATTLKQTTLFTPEFRRNPYAIYAKMRAETPVYQTTLPDKKPVWLLTRYDDVVALTKDERYTKNKAHIPGMKPEWVPPMFRALAVNMLDVDPPDHTRLRNLVHKAFTPKVIEAMRNQIQMMTDELLDKAERKGRTMDLIEDFALPLPVQVIASMLGIPDHDRMKFHKWSKSSIDASSTGNMLRVLPSMWMFTRCVRNLIKLRRNEPGDDLISSLIKAEEAGDSLSEDELVAMVFILLIAGHETTVNLIASGTLALLQNPQQKALFMHDPAVGRTAIEELLRYTTPVEMLTERYAMQPITLHGSVIPTGAMVLGVVAAANRDASIFDNPEGLDITRQNNKHLSFGQGIHYCVGSPLARMEGQIAISTLLHRMPELKLTVAPESLKYRPVVFLRGLETIPVSF